MIRAAGTKKMRGRGYTVSFALVAAFFLTAPLGTASAKDGTVYTTLKAGRYRPRSSENVSNYNGPMKEFAVGYFLSPGIVAEAGIGDLRTELHFMSGHGFKMSGTPVTLSLVGVQVGENFVSSAGIGWGIYYQKLKTVSGSLLIHDEDRVSGYHFSLGYDFFIGRRASVGFEYKIIWTQTAEFNNNSGGRVRADFSGTSLLVNLAYRF